MLNMPQAPSRRASHARGTVVVIHGFAEHSGRFEPTVARLKQIGWDAIAITLKGHGQEGLRPDIQAFDDYLPQISQVIDQLSAQNQANEEQPPVVLLGQSMGAIIACRLALSRHVGVAGLILSSPAFGVADQVPRVALSLLKWIGRWAPTAPLVPPPKGGAKALSQLAQEQANFENDRLCWHGWLGPRMANELAYASIDTEDRIHDIKIPVLMLWGDADTVIAPNAILRISKKSIQNI
jgi:acylglycerol lipase